MSGITTRGIRYPDATTKAVNLGTELKTMATDLDAYVYAHAVPGPQGDSVQGLPGPGATPADEAVAGYITTAGTSATQTALDARDAALVAGLGLTGLKVRVGRTSVTSNASGDASLTIPDPFPGGILAGFIQDADPSMGLGIAHPRYNHAGSSASKLSWRFIGTGGGGVANFPTQVTWIAVGF